MADTAMYVPATSSVHVTVKNLQALEKWRERDPDHIALEAAHYASLPNLWGQPCFEQVELPANDSGISSAPRARESLQPEADPLLFRADYASTWTSLSYEAGGAGIIWGQPGIGKSSELDILSLICTEQRIPFGRYAVGIDTAYVLIDTNVGPRLYNLPAARLCSLNFIEPAYFFVDAGSAVDFPLPLQKNVETLMIIFASSPCPVRYKEMAKQSLLRQIPPSESPSTSNAASPFRFFQDLSFDVPSGYPTEGYSDDIIARDISPSTYVVVDDSGTPVKRYRPLFRYHIIGPDIRSCFSDLNHIEGEDEEEAQLRGFNFRAIFDKPSELASFLDGAGENPHAYIHEVLYHQPAPVTPLDRWHLRTPLQKVIVPSAFVRGKLSAALARFSLEEQRALLRATSFYGGCLYSLIYEQYVNTLTLLEFAENVSSSALPVPSSMRLYLAADGEITL
ncbi:hypothetical protein JCM11251_001901 [Rhodosporidiobolus azoricus]